MPTTINCPHCKAKLGVPDNAAGKTIQCPKCQGRTAIPAITAPVPVAALSPGKLIACSACQNMIALTATACPKCGAANTWIHPEIKRFIENAIVSGDVIGTDRTQFGSPQFELTRPTVMAGPLSAHLEAPYTGALVVPPPALFAPALDGVFKRAIGKLNLSDAERIADARNLARGLRVIAVLDSRDDVIACARCESELSEVRRETHDPLRRRRDRPRRRQRPSLPPK